MHVFTYGTLMCADIMAAACGGLPAAEPATLVGFSRHPVSGEAYPGIRDASGGCVAGLLYRDVDSVQLARLDAFEGLQYRRATVTVLLEDGRQTDAETYVFADHCLHLLEAGEWDFEAFLRAHRSRFERRYLGFQRV